MDTRKRNFRALLPDRIDINELQHFVTGQIEFGKKMLAAFNASSSEIIGGIIGGIQLSRQDSSYLFYQLPDQGDLEETMQMAPF